LLIVDETRLPEWRERSLRLLCFALAAALILYFVSLVADVLLLIFAGILLATLLHGLARLVVVYARLPAPVALTLVVAAMLVAAAATGYLLAPRVSEQLSQLVTRVPADFHKILSPVEQTPWGKALLQSLPPHGGGSSRGMVRGIFGAASSTFDMLAAMVIAVFLGLYLAAEPATYLAGGLRLLPLARRRRLRATAEEVALTLRWWLLGRFLSMALIAAMTSIGLSLLGVQLAITLGILAGILTFIPYIGSAASAVPAILIALTQNGQTALYVLLLYVGVHIVEGYILVPLMQKKMVHVPPALTLAAQALLGALFGILGLALATPLVAAAVTAVRLLYVEDVLADDMQRSVL
jgi:predicted PurR-regulated permease PerM